MRPEPFFVVAALAACGTTLGTEVTRAAAKSAVNPVIAQRYPGIPLQPATDCVIDNATSSEIITLASSAPSGGNETATRIVLDVVSRPETIECLATDGLPVLLNTL